MTYYRMRQILDKIKKKLEIKCQKFSINLLLLPYHCNKKKVLIKIKIHFL